MLTLLSPAKKLETSKLDLSLELTLPEFNIDTKKILAVLKNKSVADLQKLYSVSKEIAELNFQRFKDFDHDYKEENTKASLFMFAGEVYNGLDANNFSNQELDFANSNTVTAPLIWHIRWAKIRCAKSIKLSTYQTFNRLIFIIDL